LRGDADQSAASPDRVLERLTASAVVRAFEPKASVAPAVSAVNQAKLESLATVETTVATPAPVPTPEATQASLSQANEKLSNLLGGPKK